MAGPPDDGTDPRVQRLIEESSDVIAVVAPDGRFDYLSPSTERVLGYDPDGLLGEIGFDYIHEADLETAEREFVSMIEDPERRPVAEFRFEHADGSWRWLEARGRNLLDDPAVGGLVVYVRDVTERRAVEGDLRAVRDRMEFALEATDSVIFEVDVESGTETRHGPFERLYGVSESDVRSVEAFYERAVHPDDRASVETIEAAAIDGELESIEFEYRTHPDAGDVRWIRSKAYVQDQGDGVERLIGLSTDITSLKAREAELERQNERLDQFASMVSHDLRNPLNVATGRLELAREEADIDHFEPLDRALRRMAALIDDLLTLARQGETELELEAVDLSEAVDRSWRNVETGPATLVVETDRTVRAEPSRLNQLLENLFRNAVEHAGSSATVTVRDLADGFSVEDDGPGIPEDERAAVFEAGYSTAHGGSGLGLTIVRQIADDHGWEVRPTDGSTGGARFEFTGVSIDPT